MAVKRNKKGKTWREHAAPYLRKSLKQASSTWIPKSQRTSQKKLVVLRKQKEVLARKIKIEVEKG